ncbi:hypothetical protein ACIQGT_36545 [Streptomyces sp. NPDC093108]|uniref:hypothetical protein n=1 Tax=Streptomyces sp. NPDC093108 TaxID=3366030 RepID=UPI0038013965
MTNPAADPAEQAAAVIGAEYPALYQAEPSSIGTSHSLANVELTPQQTARYSCGDYDVHVAVGPEDYLNADDPEDTALHRLVRATAVLVAPALYVDPRAHVEWVKHNPKPVISFPTVHVVATADRHDPRFASAVLAAIGMALDYARATVPGVAEAAEKAAAEAEWERERPADVPRRRWLRQKDQERSQA